MPPPVMKLSHQHYMYYYFSRFPSGRKQIILFFLPHPLRASETRTGAYISTDSFFFFFLPSSQINILNISRGSIVYVCYIICVPLVRRPFLSFDSRLLLPAPRLCEHHGSEKSIRRAAITTESPQTTPRANPLI